MVAALAGSLAECLVALHISQSAFQKLQEHNFLEDVYGPIFLLLPLEERTRLMRDESKSGLHKLSLAGRRPNLSTLGHGTTLFLPF